MHGFVSYDKCNRLTHFEVSGLELNVILNMLDKGVAHNNCERKARHSSNLVIMFPHEVYTVNRSSTYRYSSLCATVAYKLGGSRIQYTGFLLHS